MKRRMLVLSIVAVVAVVGLLWIVKTREAKVQSGVPPGTPPLEIAVIFDLTGSLSYMGQWSFEGAKIAEDQLNEEGGIEETGPHGKERRRIQLVVEDGGTDPGKTKDAYERLQRQDKHPVVMGFNQSGEVLALAPITVKDNVLLFSTGAASPKISSIGGKMVFRNRLSSNVETSALASLAYDNLTTRRVLLATMNTEYGIGFSDAFTKHIEAKGGKVVGDVRFDQGQVDYAPTVLEIQKVSGYDTLCIAANAREGARLIKALNKGSVRVQHIIGANALDAPELADIAGDAADSLIIAVAKFDPGSPAAAEFSRRYRAQYGHDPEMFAANAYDAVRLLANTYAQGARTGADFSRILSGGTSFPGVSGPTKFDKSGDVQREVCLKIFKEGKFHIISP